MKKRIIEGAIGLYLQAPEQWSVHDVADAAGVEREDVFRLFGSLHFVLPAFYDSCLAQYAAIRDAIDGYETFTLEERLSTFVYVLFDLLEEQRAFVVQTFSPFVVEGRGASDFRAGVRDALGVLLTADDVPSVNQVLTSRLVVRDVLARAYLALVAYWTRDESPQREQSLALADKLVAFFVELATFRGIERGIDLAKYLVNVGIINVDALPFVGRWFAREQEGQTP